MTSLSRLDLPVRRRSYRFALTPLADAMFQLLIFFMLSSSLAPYSLITLKEGAALAEQSGTGIGDTGEAPQPQAQADVALWTLEADAIFIGGQRFGFDAIDDLAEALGTQDSPASVLLLLRSSARVQDMATVLARLRQADVTSVRVATEAE